MSTINVVQITCEVTIPAKHVERFQIAPHVGPSIVLLSGGSGASTLATCLTQYTHNSIHVVTMYDDGGSSKIIRNVFNIPPPGDLRNRLMNLADESARGRSEIVEVFRHRLPSSEHEPGILQMELDSFIDGSHPKMKAIEPGFANIIGLYLSEFNQRKISSFDLPRASIGNLVMTGCYFLHGNSFEKAVYLISSLAKIRGTVIPVTLGNYYLGAELLDRTIIYGQAKITNQGGRYESPITRVFFVEQKTDNANEVDVFANPRAIGALSNVDVIVYSMGSYYTSIIPCLMTQGIAEAIRVSPAPKVMIANSTEDDETRGLTVSGMLSGLADVCRKYDPQPGNIEDYVQYVITNDHGESKEYRGRGNYIPVDRDQIDALGVKLLEYPLEDGRGRFNPDLVSRIILSFAHM